MYTLTQTKEQKQIILNRIAEGESLLQICKDKSTPDDNTVYKWLNIIKITRIEKKMAQPSNNYYW